MFWMRNGEWKLNKSNHFCHWLNVEVRKVEKWFSSASHSGLCDSSGEVLKFIISRSIRNKFPRTESFCSRHLRSFEEKFSFAFFSSSLLLVQNRANKLARLVLKVKPENNMKLWQWKCLCSGNRTSAIPSGPWDGKLRKIVRGEPFRLNDSLLIEVRLGIRRESFIPDGNFCFLLRNSELGKFFFSFASLLACHLAPKLQGNRNLSTIGTGRCTQSFLSSFYRVESFRRSSELFEIDFQSLARRTKLDEKHGKLLPKLKLQPVVFHLKLFQFR